VDTATAAGMSDPDRNGNFRRRWSEPMPRQPRAVPEPLGHCSLELLGRELRYSWRRSKTALLDRQP
jgi:hypothetical protein